MHEIKKKQLEADELLEMIEKELAQQLLLNGERLKEEAGKKWESREAKDGGSRELGGISRESLSTSAR